MNLELSEKNKQFRQKIIDTDPIICPERAVIWTEVYKKNEDKTPIMKAALALKETLHRMTITIYDEDTIVGNQGSGLRATTLNPPGNTWYIEELDDFEKRDGSRFLITEEAKQQLRDITPYWEGKTVFDNTMGMLPDDIKDALDAIAITCGYTLTKGCGHWLLNIENVLKNGFRTFKERAQAALDEIDFTDPEGVFKIPFYEAVIIVCDAVCDFAKRYADLAREKAQTADGDRKAELLKIAEVCDWVPYEAPRNFREAVQTVYFVQLITQIESDGTGISLGRLDNMLYPFYKKDIEENKITKKEAGDLIDSLLLKICSIIQIWNEPDSKVFGGHPISQALTLGGQDEFGRDATNDLSYMFLESTARTHIPQPSVCVRVNRNSPDDFLMLSAEVIREGMGMPAMYNDEIAIPSLVSRGVSIEDARREFGVIGCVEMGVQGKLCDFANSGYVNMVKVLEMALNDGFDPMSGKQLGPHTGKAEDFLNFEALLDAYMVQMRHMVDGVVSVANVVNTMHAKLLPLPFMSAITEDCIGKGLEAQSGGAKYNYDGMQGVGLADVVDSFTAIKKLVFEDKRIPMKKMMEALKANFEGYEDVRLMVTKEMPKYGNNIPEVDNMARDIVQEFCIYVGKHKNPRGGFFVPGMYSNSANVPLGEVCGATPNGRKATTPIAEACSPSHHMDKNGPTQAAMSVATLDHMLMTNGSQYNQKYHPTALEGIKGLRSLVDLVRTYFEAGGYHIQFNIVSADVLKEAQQAPDQNRDLVVRVAGYTAFFTDLNSQVQDDIIDRTEMDFG